MAVQQTTITKLDALPDNTMGTNSNPVTQAGPGIYDSGGMNFG